MARIHLIGLGAVGAVYASRFLDSGADLRVVADAERLARYRAEPTVVNGRAYDFPLLDDDQPADIVILAVKQPQLGAAIDALRPAVTADTVVLSLLNGIDSERSLAAAFPEAVVLYAISVGIDAVRTGRQVRYTSPGRIIFGEAGNPGPLAERVQWVAGILDRAGIDHLVPPDMLHELWWKFLINVGVNQVSAVIQAPYRVLQTPGQPAREVMIAAQREVIGVANALGIGLGEADIDRWLDVLDGLGPDSYTSMAQDALAGRVSEVDSFAGTMIRLGSQAGVPVPVNTVLYGLLKGAEEVLART